MNNKERNKRGTENTPLIFLYSGRGKLEAGRKDEEGEEWGREVKW